MEDITLRILLDQILELERENKLLKADIRELEVKLRQLEEPYSNPFKCGHAARFVWTEALTGQKTCTACVLLTTNNAVKLDTF